MIDLIKEVWGWIGIEPIEIVGENAFGNLLIKDVGNQYWRITPEELSCEIVAKDELKYQELCKDDDFALDWSMEKLVNEARGKLGTLPEGHKYCLKIPGVVGGEYGGDNLGTVPFKELIAFSGDLANQIKDLPDGAEIKFNILE